MTKIAQAKLLWVQPEQIQSSERPYLLYMNDLPSEVVWRYTCKKMCTNAVVIIQQGAETVFEILDFARFTSTMKGHYKAASSV